jgi:hypothetical protein
MDETYISPNRPKQDPDDVYLSPSSWRLSIMHHVPSISSLSQLQVPLVSSQTYRSKHLGKTHTTHDVTLIQGSCNRICPCVGGISCSTFMGASS